MDTTDKFLELKNELQRNSKDLKTFNKFTELTELFFEVRQERFAEGLNVAAEIYNK